MCGICGMCNSQSASADIKCMMDAIARRGPDDSGDFIDANMHVAFGHRRLSILDLSSSGRQPMTSMNKRYVISYNGEIYNYSYLVTLLPDSVRRKLKSTTDTEVLLELFSLNGVKNTLKNLRGMFAIALYDNEEKCIYLIRDRAGEKPLYYGFLNGMFVFASELKAIQNVAQKNNVVLTLNYDAISMFLRHSYIPAPYSIYKEIKKVEAAEIVKINAPFKEVNNISKYWNLEEHIETINIGKEEAKRELKELLTSTISEQMVSDVPYGAFLSGGIDSSLIVSYMQKNTSAKIKTFSIGFQTPSYNEATFAKAVANHIGCNHEELYVTDDEAMKVIPLIPDIYDEPYADSSQIPTYLVSKLAKQKVTVALTGDAGDELFCGYTHYQIYKKYYEKIQQIPKIMRLFLARVLETSPFETINSKTFNNKIDKLSRLLKTPNVTNFFYEMILADTSKHSLMSPTVPSGYFTSLSPKLSSTDIIKTMQFLDFNLYLQNDILVKVDRAAMNNSLETRVPFLDKRIIEFAFSLPMSLKINELGSKAILRELLYDEVPKELLERPKMGFGIPLDEWLRGPLKNWSEEMICSEALRELPGFDYEQARYIWKKHLMKQGNYKTILWNIILLAQWLKHNRKFYKK